MCGVVVEQARGGLEETFVAAGVTQAAGFELSGERLDGGYGGGDVALGSGRWFRAPFCSKVLEEHQTFGVLRCGL